MFDMMEETTTASPWDDPADFESMIAAVTALAADTLADVGNPIPPGLDQIEPGPLLAAMLAEIDVDLLDPYDRVVALRAHARMAAHSQAHMFKAMASVTDAMRDIYGDDNYGAKSAAAEIELALHLTRRASEHELALALDLRERLPQVWEQLASGNIDLRRARTIAKGTSHLPQDRARQVVDTILDVVDELTTGQIAARLRRLCLESDPEDAKRRYDVAVEERRVIVEQNPSGTGNLYAMDMPVDRVTAIHRHIHNIAMGYKSAGDTRTMDQLRTDVFLDLLEGTVLDRASSRGVVDIQVDLAMLSHLSSTPGDVGGFGPIIADIARQMVADSPNAEWRWTVTDGAGSVIANGITRRRPTSAMRRHVEARQRRCVFPGCRMPATQADLDHTVPWAESRTTRAADMAPLCRHHHTVRHLPGWSYRIDSGGHSTWRTPLRHTYVRRGPPRQI